jgi:hypothetical protein
MANELDHILSRPARGLGLAITTGLGGTRPPHVSTAANRFTLVDAAGSRHAQTTMDKDGPYIDVIIVDANPYTSRRYFDGPYDEDSPSPPACFSDNGTGPSVNSPRPQGTTCAACPKSVWGSAQSKLTGEDIPACSSLKKLAVLVVGDNDGLVYALDIMAGSWNGQTGWKRYATMLASHPLEPGRMCEPNDVVTRVSFVPNRMGVMGFKAVSMISPEQAETVDEIWEQREDETARIVGKSDKARDPGLPLVSRQTAPAPAAVSPPAPQVQAPPPPARSVGRPKGSTKKVAASEPDIIAPTPPTPPFIQQSNVSQSPGGAGTPPPATGMQMPGTPDDQLKAALARYVPPKG